MVDATEAINVVRNVLAGNRYRYLSEVDLHRGLEAAMRDAGLDVHPEQQVTGGRIDFLVNLGVTVVGIEVKIKGNVDALRRQVERYAEDVGIHGFLVVTTKHTHTPVARPANSKPVDVLVIGGLGL